MTPGYRSQPSSQLTTTIGVGTGVNARLVDPGAARALAYAAEELGYSSVWTFDSSAAQHSTDATRGRSTPDVLATLEALAAATSRVAVGAALLRSSWPLGPAVVDRLVALRDTSSGRVVLARPYSDATDSAALGPMLQVWSPDSPDLAPWADGWMIERWERDMPDPPPRPERSAVVVRLPVHEPVERIVDQIADLLDGRASEIVLDVVADAGLDRALDLYSRIAEAVESSLDRRTA